MTNSVQNKYEIFASLSRELTDLIKNLEKELKNKLNLGSNAPEASKPLVKTPVEPGKTLGYKIGHRLGSFWNRLSRPSLKEYSEYMGVIDALYGELIEENFNILSEDYTQVSPIIDKFKVDFIKVLVKYQNILKPEVEKAADQAKKTADQEEIKATGAPDTTSATDVQALSDEVEELKPKIKKSVDQAAEDDMKIDSIDPSYFSNGEVKPEFSGKVFEWLIHTGIVKNENLDENKISSALSGYGYTRKNFSYLINHAYKKEDLIPLIFKIKNKSLILRLGIKQLANEFKKFYRENPKKAEQIFEEIEKCADGADGSDMNSVKDVLQAITQKEEVDIGDKIEFTVVWNIHMKGTSYLKEFVDILENSDE